MLILTRKSGEALRIGDEITVTVIGIKGAQVRLGIDAPQGFRIYRTEISQENPDRGSQDGAPVD